MFPDQGIAELQMNAVVITKDHGITAPAGGEESILHFCVADSVGNPLYLKYTQTLPMLAYADLRDLP